MSASKSSGQLLDHLQALLGQSRRHASESVWTDLLDTWQATGIPVRVEKEEPQIEVPVGIPLPTLLDYYNPPALGARLDDPTNHAISFRPSGSGAGGYGDYAEDQVSNEQDSDAAELTERLTNHIASETSFRSLLDLLSSSSTPEELQDDVMGVLGWEPASFDLVTELFAPGMREGVLRHGRGNTLRAEAGVFSPNSRAPVDPAAESNRSANVPRNHTEGLSFIEAQLEQNANRPLISGTSAAIPEAIQYPHVYTSTSSTAVTSYGGRLALPMGTIRKEKEHAEEVVIPPANPVPPKVSERLIPVNELGPMAAGCFPGYQTLNRIQSIVQPVAMTTNENMLICAPTGAGKTDVAVMSILRVLSQNVRQPEKLPYGPNSILKDDFKIIYVAPMKALAAEITRKIGKRLAWLGIQVRELTGDMQLTRKEIGETQIIVTTPEKWDVVTRKPTGEGELASKVKLLIIDEVHLLNEDRGAVIETIVARTLRLVESSQSLIRIVGLSATLPNYIDVSDFLRVNRYQGLFFFDSSFRPVPLEQHFIGVRGKVRSETSKRNMDQAVFDKVVENLAQGHQVMVFVHARKETVKTAERLKEMAQMEGNPEDFDPRAHPQFDFFRREVGLSRNKEMKQLFDYGFGIHHAGMLRSDRNMMERMFEANCIKVLCCTSTLAWGVNLPAHAVVIKGTQVYDAGKGSFVDLSILDVLQIFGRAGRPGYETSGVGYICTTQDKLDHYLDAVLSQHPIESRLVPGMVDAMNAEVSLGTISTVSEAIEWLGYTYLFVRMKRNPFNYGMAHDEAVEDPQLGSKRQGLTRTAGRRLAEIGMIRFDEVENSLTITDLGRIAAKYYLKHETVEIFNQHFKARMTEADTLALLSMSTEFHQLQVRENEVPELQALMKDIIPCQVKGGTDTSQGKVNILLQAYICRAHIEDFALVSDTAYVAQNAGRIIRALLEIALSRKWGNAASVLASMSKSIEKQMWSYQNPLRQSKLQYMVLHNLETHADDYAPAELCEMTPVQAGELIKMNDKHGAAIVAVAKQFPTIGVTYDLRPLSHDLLQISLHLSRNFQWSQTLHGFSEPFWVWIEDSSTSAIFQYQNVLFKPSTTLVNMEFVVPIRTTNPPAYVVRVISDRWVGSEEEVEISLAELAMPAEPEPPTPLLSVPYLSLTKVLKPLDFGTGYADRFSSYNNIQSQVFWPLFNTDESILLAAPNGSGKSTIGDVATWRTLQKKRNSRVIYLSPNRHFAADMMSRLKELALSGTHLQIRRLDSMANFEHHKHNAPCIGVATPMDLLVHLGGDPDLLHDLDLIIMDDLHLLDEAYEMIILRILLLISYSTTRVVGLSSSLQDAHSLADWLQIPSTGTYTFRPTDRAMPLINHIQPYSIPHSAILLKTMVKPVYAAVKAGLPRTTVIFVPSRLVCKTVANDLVTQSGMMLDINGFLAAPRQDIERNVQKMKDSTLVEPLLHGIGIYHEGMHYQDLTITLSLFAAEVVRVLIVPRESCWTLPVHAGNVIVMGAQYLELETSLIPGEPPERRLRNYTLNELIRMQGFASWPTFSGSLAVTSNGNGSSTTEGGARFTLMCQSEQKDTYQRFLDEGLPLESRLPSLLLHTADRQLQATLSEMLGDEPKRQDLMDLVAWSYLWIRMRRNPNYYDILDEDLARRSLSRMVDGYFDEVYKRRKRAQGRKGLIDHLPVVGGEAKVNGKGGAKGASKGKGKALQETTDEDNDVSKAIGVDDEGTTNQARDNDQNGETDGEEADLEDNVRTIKTGDGADDSDGDEAGDEMTEKEQPSL